jgi:hypothetical protein
MSDDYSPRELVEYQERFAAMGATCIATDSTIISIAGGGIGLLVAIASFGKTLATGEQVMFIFGALAFTVAVVTGVLVLKLNADFLKALIEKNKPRFEKFDRILAWLDCITIAAFLVGIACATVFGVIMVLKG